MHKDTSPRDRIIQTAERLFNSQGVHTTGIDQIIEESSVAKKTFYHHFPSKSDLIAEYFRVKDESWFSRLRRHTLESEKNPLEQVLGLFDALKEWFAGPDFHGCPFIRGLTDFSDPKDEPVLRQCVSGHFDLTIKLVTELLKPVRPDDYADFVPQIMSLIAGATVLAHATKDPGAADVNREMARRLLEAR